MVKDNYKIFRYILNNSHGKVKLLRTLLESNNYVHGEDWVSPKNISKNKAFSGTYGDDWFNHWNQRTPRVSDRENTGSEIPSVMNEKDDVEDTRIFESILWEEPEDEIDVHQNDNEFLSLPLELIDQIFSYLDFYEVITTIPHVCLLLRYVMSTKNLECLSNIRLEPNKHLSNAGVFTGRNFYREISTELFISFLRCFGKNLRSLAIDTDVSFVSNTQSGNQGSEASERIEKVKLEKYDLISVRGARLYWLDYIEQIAKYSNVKILKTLKLDKVVVDFAKLELLPHLEILELYNCPLPVPCRLKKEERYQLWFGPREKVIPGFDARGKVRLNHVKKLVIDNTLIDVHLWVPNCSEMKLSRTQCTNIHASENLIAATLEFVRDCKIEWFEDKSILENLTLKYAFLKNFEISKVLSNLNALKSFSLSYPIDVEHQNDLFSVSLKYPATIRRLSVSGIQSSEVFYERIFICFPKLVFLEVRSQPKDFKHELYLDTIISCVMKLKNIEVVKFPRFPVNLDDFLLKFRRNRFEKNIPLREVVAAFNVPKSNRFIYYGSFSRPKIIDLIRKFENRWAMTFLVNSDAHLGDVLEKAQSVIDLFSKPGGQFCRRANFSLGQQLIVDQFDVDKYYKELNSKLLDTTTKEKTEMFCSFCGESGDQLQTTHICEDSQTKPHRSVDFLDYLVVCHWCSIEIPFSEYHKHCEVHLESGTPRSSEKLFISDYEVIEQFVESVESCFGSKSESTLSKVSCVRCSEVIDDCVCEGGKKSDFYEYLVKCLVCRKDVLLSKYTAHLEIHSKEVLNFNKKSGKSSYVCPYQCGHVEHDTECCHGKLIDHLQKCENYEIWCMGCGQTMLMKDRKSHLETGECKREIVHMLFHEHKITFDFFKENIRDCSAVYKFERNDTYREKRGLGPKESKYGYCPIIKKFNIEKGLVVVKEWKNYSGGEKELFLCRTKEKLDI